MNIASGHQYRSFAAQNEFSFLFNIINSTSSGISNIGFSGSANNYLNLFKFNSGQILDTNNKYVWSYNPREEIYISGNIGPGYLNYFINDIPVCLYSPHSTSYYDNFYINTQNSNIDYDFFINGVLPTYSFEYNPLLNVSDTFTGYIKNLSSFEKSFKIFSGQLLNNNFTYLLEYFDSGTISGEKSGIFLFKPINVSVSEITESTSNLILNTNFGILNETIVFNIYPSPIYFIDFITGYTGEIGSREIFTLEKLYNYELQSIYPKDRPVTFILQNISGHTGNKIYSEFDASGYVSGLISGFIHGFDYITGIIYGSGQSISQKDYYDDYPTGILEQYIITEQYATGEIIYNYNLPIYGGYGTGISPVGTVITGSGIASGIFSGFVYGQTNLYDYKDTSLTGVYKNNINIKTGNLLVYTPAFFTGLLNIQYDNFLWSCNEITGTGYFSGENFSGYSDKIIGITGFSLIYFYESDSGKRYLNTTIFKNQTQAEVLIPLIGQNNGLFLNSGNIYAYESNHINTYPIFKNDIEIKNSVTGNNYIYFTGGYDIYGFIFSFDGYNVKDKGNIQYFSFDIDKKNALYRPEQPIKVYLTNESSPTGLYPMDTLSTISTILDTGKLYDSNTYFFKCSNPSLNLNVNNTYTHIKLEISGKKIFEHQSTGNNDLIKSVGIKNFQIYRSIPVSQLNGLEQIQYNINTNNMTGYSTPSGNILKNKSYSGTIINSQDSIAYPAWYAFNSNKNLYPYAEIFENFEGESTIGYALNNPLDKIFSGFFIEFENTGNLLNYLGVEVSDDGINYYECYNKTSNIQLIETGYFSVGTGFQYFRLNFTPLPECVYSPYSDACYQKVIKNYPHCCETIWDDICELSYQGCTGAFPPGIDPPVYIPPFSFTVLNGILEAGDIVSILLNGSGNPEIWGGSVENIDNQNYYSGQSGLKNFPINATGLKSIYMPFVGAISLPSGVAFGIGCTGNLVMWGQTGTGDIGIIPNNLGPIKKVVWNDYGGPLILKENNTIVTPEFSNSLKTVNNENLWTGISHILNSNNIIDIDAGFNHYLALLSDGSVCAWGLEPHLNDINGVDLNWGDLTNLGNLYLKSGYNNIKAIAAGYDFSLFISGNINSLVNIGSGFDYGSSIGGSSYYPYSEILPPSLNNVKSISAGKWNGMAIYSNQYKITGWGVNTETGNIHNNGQNVFAWTPTTGIYAIAAGLGHSLALRRTGDNYEVVRWGNGSGVSDLSTRTGFFSVKPILTGYISGYKYC